MWIRINKKGDMINTDRLTIIQREPESDGNRIRFAGEMNTLWSDALTDVRAALEGIVCCLDDQDTLCDITPYLFPETEEK